MQEVDKVARGGQGAKEEELKLASRAEGAKKEEEKEEREGVRRLT